VLLAGIAMFGPATPARAADPPSTKITSGPKGPTGDTTPTFTFKSDAAGADFRCKLDASTFVLCDSPRTLPPLSDGPHTFVVVAHTAAGGFDPTPAEREFSVKSSFPDGSPPNILLIVTDDQPAVGTMQEMPRTLDFFSQGGTRYRNGYVTTPICCPSRASIFSGQYAHNHGITIQDGTGFDTTKTWQRALYDEGYYTGILGKYLNKVPTRLAPFFDFFRVWFADEIEKEVRGIEKAAEKFIRLSEHEDDDRPWALMYATYSPHEPVVDAHPKNPKPIEPWNKPPSFGESNRDDKHPLLEPIAKQFDPKRALKLRRGQLRELQAVDESMGKLFRALGEMGERSNTLVIYMSDNGYFWGQHSIRGKQWPYLEGSHVPFLVKWPGHTPVAGTQDLVANIDVAPTIFDVTNIAPGYTVDGQSLFQSSGWPRPWLLIENPTGDQRHPAWHSYLSPSQHYISYPAQFGEPAFYEHYNLGSDPWELDGNPNTLNSTLESQIITATSCAGASCP
jgi:arylsulfatase A-like enzyme